jgi:hypothetical protein
MGLSVYISQCYTLALSIATHQRPGKKKERLAKIKKKLFFGQNLNVTNSFFSTIFF